MGGSALRGMAFGKPVVVVGAEGFASAVTPQTADYFSYYGIYGIGDGDRDNARLRGLISELAMDRAHAEELGRFARSYVASQFGLDRVAGELAACYDSAVTERASSLTVLAEFVDSMRIWRPDRSLLRRTSGALRVAPRALALSGRKS
jgi:hypothetical protein